MTQGQLEIDIYGAGKRKNAYEFSTHASNPNSLASQTHLSPIVDSQGSIEEENEARSGNRGRGWSLRPPPLPGLDKGWISVNKNRQLQAMDLSQASNCNLTC